MTTHHKREATCPVCNGTKRVPAGASKYKTITATYDEKTDTFACRNCGGQTMSLSAQGVTRVDPATGLGCLHTYVGQQAGNCYNIYTCTKCGDRYDIDSGD